MSRLFAVEEHHGRLLARLLLALTLSLVVLTVGTILIWAFESGHKGGDISTASAMPPSSRPCSC
jgi:hypothetical protein